MTSDATLMRRNATLYPWYRAAYDGHFWLPVFFLYFSDHFSIERVLQLEAIYYASVVLMEVPSGYFSDAVGRRATLIISATALVLAHTLFLVGDAFWTFALAQGALACAMAFKSGTDTSLLYESIQATGDDASYGDQEARAASWSFRAAAIAACAGGFSALINLRLAYALSLFAGIAALVLTTRFTETGVHGNGDAEPRTVTQQAGVYVNYLKDRALLWLFAYSVGMTVLNHIPYEFYQPYVKTVTQNLGASSGAPAVTGVHAAITMLIAGTFAARSMALARDRGTAAALLMATNLQVSLIALMAIWTSPLVVMMLLLRSSPRGLMAAPLNAAVTPRIDAGHRATYLSVQSFAGRLGFSAYLLLMSQATTAVGTETGNGLGIILWMSLVFGVAVLAGLVLWSRRINVDAPGPSG